MNIAICCILKQENLYLRDWVEYYYNMGCCNIIMYDNNDENGEYPQQVIGDYIRNGFVIYKNARGKYRYQIEAYNTCYNEYKNTFDWIGFLDIDEYWYLTPSMTFESYFSEERLGNAISIFMNWLNYGDNDKLHYECKPVTERFPKPTFPLDFISNDNVCNTVQKLFVKCVNDGFYGFFDVNAFYYDDINFTYYTEDVNYTISYIKHYRTLTIEEFLHRRFCRKGYADDTSLHDKDFIMSLFWDQNEWTQEKQNIVDEFFERFEVITDNPKI